MTREEAKDKITELAKENFWGCGECLEALEMAIKALEQEPCNDCISRKSVEELISNNNDKYGYSDRFHEFTEECMKLPPVQPKQDCISREQAIEWVDNLRKMDECFGNHKGDYYPLSEVIDRLQNVPSATPQEPKKGYWIYLKHNKAKCSECDDVVLIAQTYGNANFCPNCGVDMRGEEN